MCRQLLRVVALLVFPGVVCWATDKPSPMPTSGPKGDVPHYTIAFKAGEPVPGVGAALAIRLPFECTSDGTAFIDIVQSAGTGGRPSNLAKFWPASLLTSIGLSGEAHSFPLNQVPDLHDISEMGHFATNSKVLFLLRAAPGNGPVLSASGQPQWADHHNYVLTFDRDGTYQRKMQLDDGFQIQGVGLFPTGDYLAAGFDEHTSVPKLAILKDDGSVLEYLTIPKGGMPDSVYGTGAEAKARNIKPVQLVGREHSIYLVQDSTDFPILEVSESGVIRAVQPKLPKGFRIRAFVPGDENLYVREDGKENEIYELDAQTGAVLKQLAVGGQPADYVACVHERKFLSFRSTETTLVPLVGTAEASH